MRTTVIVLSSLVLVIVGLYSYSFSDKAEKQIGLLRIEEGCVDIFEDLGVETQQIKTNVRELGIEEALEVELKVLRPDANENVRAALTKSVENSYSNNQPLKRVIVQSPPSSFCFYTGFTWDSMSDEVIQIGLQQIENPFLDHRIDTDDISNNNSLLMIEDITAWERVIYAIKLIFKQ